MIKGIVQWGRGRVSMALLLAAITGLLGCGGQPGESASTITVLSDTTGIDTASVEVRIKRLTEQLRFASTNWSLWYERSLLWYEAGNTARAMADIEKAIEYNFDNPDNYHMRGFYYYVQNQDSAALRDFKRAADLNSENPETYYHIGQIYFFKKKFQEAEEAYNHAIKVDSMEPTYYFARGFMRQQQDRSDEAIKEYELALRRNPTFVKALLALHDIYLDNKKDADKAYGYNERIIAIDSTQPVARYNQGNFFFNRANRLTDEAKLPEYQVMMKIAIAEFSKCLQSDPNFVRAYYNRGYSYYLIEKYPQALSDFSMVIELDPFDKKAFFMKASIQEYQGDLQSALANYKQALELDPKFKDAEIAVRELSAKLGGKAPAKGKAG